MPFPHPRHENDGTEPGASAGARLDDRHTALPPAEVADDLQELERSLSAVATRTQVEVGGCDGLGITVQLGDKFALGHCNTFARTVDLVQYGLMEGPCLLAQTTGSEVRSSAIGTGEQRWPRFTPRAAAVGLRSVVSAPLFAAEGAFASLNLYGTTVRRFSGLGSAALTGVAGRVEQALRSPVQQAATRANARWFALAVQDRADVDRAAVVLMDRYRMGRAEAQVLIQQIAHEDDVSEIDAARTVIEQDGS